eukprot:scaffold7557_cov277-Pinguiococcus_pyrenoidosus.AAC.1
MQSSPGPSIDSFPRLRRRFLRATRGASHEVGLIVGIDDHSPSCWNFLRPLNVSGCDTETSISALNGLTSVPVRELPSGSP